jgi:hypothetical protein
LRAEGDRDDLGAARRRVPMLIAGLLAALIVVLLIVRFA